VRFIDGKHRFCVYRDLGLTCVPVLVPRSQRDAFNRRFRARRAERRLVRQMVKVVRGKDAQFDTRFNSWSSSGALPSMSMTTSVPSSDEHLGASASASSGVSRSGVSHSAGATACTGATATGPTDRQRSASESDGDACELVLDTLLEEEADEDQEDGDESSEDETNADAACCELTDASVAS
jgi:hypothetical protein